MLLTLACVAAAGRVRCRRAGRRRLAAVARPRSDRVLDGDRACCTQWPPAGPPVSGRRPTWAPATARSRSAATASSCRACAIGQSIVVSAESRGRQASSGRRRSGPAATTIAGPGPRGTPTVDGDRLYVLTENGDLACLRAQDGTVVWQRNILNDFGGRNIPWLISESPLVDGNQRDRHARRAERRHGRARQDDRARRSGPARS